MVGTDDVALLMHTIAVCGVAIVFFCRFYAQMAQTPYWRGSGLLPYPPLLSNSNHKITVMGLIAPLFSILPFSNNLSSSWCMHHGI